MKRTSIFALSLLASTALTGFAHAETVASVTQVTYNYRNQPVCTATRMNSATYAALPADACAAATASTTYGPDRITKTVYDVAGQPTQSIQAYGTSLQRVYSTVAYSNNGRVTDQIDANGNRTHIVYDGFDRLLTYNLPSTTRPAAYNPSTQASALSTAGAYSTTDYEAATYDLNGNTATYRRRDGNTIAYTYDNLNREIIKDLPGGTAADVYTDYNGGGRITSKRFVSNSGPGVFYYYDGLGRMNATTDMNGRSIWIGYGYPTNVRYALVYPDGLAKGVDRDWLGRIKAVNFDNVAWIFTQTYDNNGNRTQLNRNAVAATNYTYDAFGRLLTFQNDVAGTANDVTWTFSSRNPASQVVTWGASSTGYDYKETGNTTVNQTYDGLNRDAAIAAMSGGYDARGNLTKDASRTFTYDIENRLLTKTSTTDGQPNINLTYDPEGRLASYTSGTTTTSFLYDGPNLIAEYDGAGNLLRRYIHGDGVDEPIVWIEGAGTTDRRYLMPNYQGSIIGYTDSAGNMAAVYKYGPYGEPKDIGNNDSWSGARFRYTGQTMLPEARLYYYRARVYDPASGHFMQTDPIGSTDDANLYAYVGNDPVNYIDPWGLQATSTATITITAQWEQFCREHPNSSAQHCQTKLWIIGGRRDNIIAPLWDGFVKVISFGIKNWNGCGAFGSDVGAPTSLRDGYYYTSVDATGVVVEGGGAQAFDGFSVRGGKIASSVSGVNISSGQGVMMSAGVSGNYSQNSPYNAPGKRSQSTQAGGGPVSGSASPKPGGGLDFGGSFGMGGGGGVADMDTITVAGCEKS